MRVSKVLYNPGISVVPRKADNKQNVCQVNLQNFNPVSQDKGGAALTKGYYLQKPKLINFRGAPWRLNLGSLGISSYGSISANEAIKAFEKLKLGNYLDIGDDKFNYWANNAIREENLSFLDRVADTGEKKKFIKYYMDFTGFPNLKEVSNRIKSAFVNAVDTSSFALNRASYSHKYDVIQAGYDGICSVGRGKALPGSDIDKAYVILKGGMDYEAEDIVNRFKGHLWENTDQRILSYNHDEAAFPQVYTENQLTALLKAADRTAINTFMRPTIWDFIPIASALPILRRAAKFMKYQSLRNNYMDDYVAANKFYIDICKRFPKGYSDRIDINNPSRENIKNIGFMIEAMREGVRFTQFGKLDTSKLDSSITYDLTNLSQLHSLKARGDRKPKRLARERLNVDFPRWSTDKQFNFIKTLIKGSCGNNTNFTTEFPEYFSKSGNDPFAPLIRALME